MPRSTPMDAGERDRYITLQQLTESTGTSGFPVESWTTLIGVFAKKIDVGGRERFTMAAGQMSAPFDARWEIPFVTSMDPDAIDVPKKRRLVYQGRVHDIVAAAEIGRRQGIELVTTAGGLLT
jgi:head-tail adaptor